MHIIQVSAAYKPAFIYGGPTMSVAKLSEVLTRHGHELSMEVLTTTANGKKELQVTVGQAITVDGVSVTYFNRLSKDHTHFSPSLLLGLHRKIKRLRKETPNTPLVVHIHAWWNLVSIFSCLVACLHRVQIVLSPRGMLTSYTLGNRNSLMKSLLHRALGQRLLRHCHIHATSEKEREDIQQHFQVKTVSVIPNFVQLGDTPRAHSSEERMPFKLLFLSRVEQKKGLELLFEALSLLDIPWQLSIAGTGDPQYILQLQADAQAKGLSPWISWLGHVSNQDKFELLSQHQMLVLSSFNENFANVVIESLSVGTPVLVSEAVGLADYVSLNELGWVCSLTARSIAAEINDAFRQEAKRLAIVQKAPQQIRHDFDEDRLAQEYLKYYKDLH